MATLAIDIGTSNSRIAIWENNDVNIITNELGDEITPTYVTFIQENEIEIGIPAQQKSNSKFISSVYEIKRFIGKKLTQLKNKGKYPFPFIDDGKGKLKIKLEVKDKNALKKTDNNEPKPFSVKVKIPTKKFEKYPEEILSLYIKKLIENAENQLNKKVKNVICSIPDCFGDEERNSLKKTIEIANLNLLEIINESIAAALSFGTDKFEVNEKFLVFDIGGGKTEIALLTKDKNNKFLVLNKTGDVELGGIEFTEKIKEKLFDYFYNKFDCDLNGNSRAKEKVLIESEKTKIKLSESNLFKISLKKILLGNDLDYDFNLDEFEDVCKDLFEKIRNLLVNFIKNSNINNNDIKKIILIGLAAKMKKIKKILLDTFPNVIILDNIQNAVVIGAAIRGAMIENKIEDKNKQIDFKDITPLSLGTRTSKDLFSKIIPKNTEIPTKEYTKEYRSTKDNQTQFRIKIYEGEHEYVTENHLITEFTVKGFEPKPKGEVKMRLTFKVDENSILQIKAEDMSNPNHVENRAIVNDQLVNYEKINLIKDDKSNYKSNISKYKKLREENQNDPTKYFEYQKKICNCYEELIKSFNLNEVQNNTTLIEKLEMYVNLLSNEYSILLNYENFLDENEINHIKNILYDYLKILISYQNCDNIYSIIESLKQNKEIYDFCHIFIFEDLYTKAQINFELKNFPKSKEFFTKALNKYNQYNLDFIINSLDNDKIKIYNEMLTLTKLNLNLIKINEKKEEGFKFKKQAIRNNLLFDHNFLQNAISAFIEANNINTNDGNDPPIDKKIHLICCKEINDLLLNKFGKDDEEIKNFVKDAGNILQNFNLKLNNLNINMSDEEFKKQFQNNNKNIIKEMQNVLKNNNFNKKCIDFIKLILTKYPPKNPFDKNFNIETEFEKNPKKVLLKIKTKYNPDNYSKESVENKAKYLMVQEIASMLNGIYSDLYK